ncbi:type I restriction endonuclease subunit R [bacterium]|nr:type I restriction endonuclease subunit R [bacterium]
MSTEQQIEEALLQKLIELKYNYRPDIRDRAALEQNFRKNFEALNMVKLTDSEFDRLLESIVTSDVFAASKHLRERNSFERDDGTPLHYTFVNLKDWCKNNFEVVNQLRINTDNSHHRYDVILLINGVPVVQIELKALAISPRRAMQQIVEYKNDPGNGYTRTLLCFMQIFIVSNRNDTWYFANNNSRHFNFDADERYLPLYQFASQDNSKVTQLDSFAGDVLAKCNLGNLVSRYMVLVASEQKLLMMRPYQIYAVKAIVDCICQGVGNGYIWHTTGSGKTLTSFKASTLLKDNPDIHKCLFVVDRKDLDRQTREEFNRFQEGCVEENTNTAALVRRLRSNDYADKVIVTTIQKLGLALDGNSRFRFKEELEPMRKQRMVFIFDECHRSQFGKSHEAIKEFFPNSQVFGFTGTPIFETNASYQQVQDQQASYRTTSDIFQQELHAYTITHAIEDRNVLRFHIDYYKLDGKDSPKPGDPFAKRAVIQAILNKHDAATAGRKFNALLATASINDAIEFYELFKEVQTDRLAQDSGFKPLNIACVFSPPAAGIADERQRADVRQLQEDLPQEKADNEHEPDKKQAALKAIVADYNECYGSNHSIGEFDLYYQDVQKRIKDQQYPSADLRKADSAGNREHKIDITIVVDMLLTGFDSKFLNTLYVDKNLRYHGLIQAFSRTNRVLNDSKPYGNILDFRQQQDKVDEAIQLFSGESAKSAKEIWLVESAPVVIERLETAVRNLDDFMQSQGLASKPEAVANLKGDAARAQFINLFKEVQRLSTQLDQYTDLTDENKAALVDVLPIEQLQGFKGVYLETAKRLKALQSKSTDETEPEVQQLDFEFVLFASAVIDYDYIMSLLASATQPTAGRQTMSRDDLIGMIAADAKFIEEREDITEYIRSLPVGKALGEVEIRADYERFKARKRVAVLKQIASDHKLDNAALQAFVDITLRRLIFDGDLFSDLFAPLGLGWRERSQAERALLTDLSPELKKLAHWRDISGLAAYEQ